MRTMEKKWYLKEEVYVEPLFNHWYAWPYLLPPVTGARHVTNTHRRIMNSFLNNYQLHILAINEKWLAGAEFLNCKEEQVPHIQGLLEELDAKCADLIELSKAVETLDEILRKHTSGESIEPLYGQVPEPLKGYVELFLDLEHRPSYRLIEPLLYRSNYYKPQLQTISFGLLSRVGERPFVLSTPRLPDDNHLHLRLGFNDERLERLLSAREHPLTQNEIESLANGLDVSGGLPFSELFAESPSRYCHQPVNSGVVLTYTGHAGFLIETSDVSILVDPVISSRGEKFANEIVSYNELPPKIDYICLTHNHQDHVNLETLLQLRHKTDMVVVPKNNGGTLADPSIRLLLKQLGFTTIEVDDLDEVSLPKGRLVAVPFLGEHGDLNVRSKTAYYIELLGRKLLFGADSSNPDNRLYERLGQLFNGIDILAIGMECVGAPYTWLYGALHTKMVPKAIKESRRLNGSDFRQAFPMVQAFDAKRVLVYALGLEPWYKYFMGIEYDDESRQIVESNKLIAACKERDIPAEALYGRKSIIFDMNVG